MLDDVVKKLKKSFTDEELKKKLLKSEWLQKNLESGIDSTGFCRLSCEIIYKLFGGKDEWLVKIISKKNWEHGSHYYLQNKKTDKILDVAKDQYESKGITIPYELGKGTGLRSNPKKLSNDAEILAKHANIK